MTAAVHSPELVEGLKALRGSFWMAYSFLSSSMAFSTRLR